MNLLVWVETFGLFQWLALGLLVGFTVWWISGSDKLNSIEDRIFRMESMDWIYEMGFGVFLLFFRNVAIWVFLLILFLLVK